MGFMPVNMVLAKTQVATISLQDCYPSYCIYSFRQAIPCGTGIEYLPLFPKLSTFANMNYAFSTFQNVCLNTKQLSSSFFFFFSDKKVWSKNLLNICRKSISLRCKRDYNAKLGSHSKIYISFWGARAFLGKHTHAVGVFKHSCIPPWEGFNWLQ